ncbi:carboxypeptidase-like regulatory domain-containing protein [Chitinophaga sedimenti]|uniref:carboxypeptidase-like regulatory domain-containing protein n=1 Tax=Chitinophaga sedimenti TaxID=2033606 RepID=UPI002002A7AF|nr:carboxypeptidase-like regulatory domain-containing protein [Chitinophaga sedimenti]MCK7554413.1 carboxypeptidase-like regulatory domain-containing protein [Chitinophaga sedimenti]
MQTLTDGHVAVNRLFKNEDKKDPAGGGGAVWGQQPPLPVVNGNTTFSLNGDQFAINVMGNDQPRMPVFPKLDVKKGYARGYVADLSGKPLKGAYIGVRGTLVGGSYSGATAETDDNGYYEMELPTGTCHYFAAGYTIDYGAGRATVSLLPSDESIATFPSADGKVRNFVMTSYGIGNRDEVAQQPGNSANYFGGAIHFDYQLNYEGEIPVPNYLPYNGEIEITLTPDGPGLFGETKSFTISKKIGVALFSVVNIPVGKYTITAKLKDNRNLKITETGTYAGSYEHWGLMPRTATGNAKLMFIPVWQVDKTKVSYYHGNWQTLNLKLEL